MRYHLIYSILVCIFICVLPLRISGQQAQNVTIPSAMDKILGSTYDPESRPFFRGEPVAVRVSLYFLKVLEINDKGMDWTADLYLRQTWRDQRLTFNKTVFPEPTITVGTSYEQKIWMPDTFVVNSKEVRRQRLAKDPTFIRLSNSGHILRSERVTVKATCEMDFHLFPFDSQTCLMEIDSFSQTYGDIKYGWNGPYAVSISADAAIPEWKTVKYRQRAEPLNLSTGNYSRLQLEVVFQRVATTYIITTWVPLLCLVILALMGVVVGKQGVLVSLVAVVGILIIGSSSREREGVASYLTAADLYAMGSILFPLVACIGTMLADQGIGKPCQGRTNGSSFPKQIIGRAFITIVVFGYLSYNIWILFVYCGITDVENLPEEGWNEEGWQKVH